MIIEFRSSFNRDAKALSDKKIGDSVIKIISEIENITDINKIPNIKKLKGYKSYYRIKISNYRIGLSFSNDIVTFVRLLPRKDIYKYFPDK